MDEAPKRCPECGGQLVADRISTTSTLSDRDTYRYSEPRCAEHPEHVVA